MKIKEKIYEGIKNMGPGELSVLYEQVRLMAKIKQKSKGKRRSCYSVKEIQEMTLSSKSSWADTVSFEREERL